MQDFRLQNPLIHFIGRKKKSEKEKLCLLSQILETEEFIPQLEEEVFGNDYFLGKGFGRSAFPICFTDLPLEKIGLHKERFSSFGIAFSKEYIIDNGGNPVFYWAQECERLKNTNNYLSRYMADLEKTIKQCCNSKMPLEAMEDLYSLIWPILRLSKPFKAKEVPNVYEEQEWRILTDGEKWKFDRSKVLFVTTPKTFIEQLKTKWPDLLVKEV